MRIAGITIPEKKPLKVGLTTVFGIGRSRAVAILRDLNISLDARPKDLSQENEHALRKQVESFTIEGELKREMGANIKHLKDVKSYRGTRHAKNLPVRGQNTRTNSRTVRGNVRRTMGSGKRKLEKT